MLIRISLILAILAAAAAGTLNVLKVRDKINTIISQRESYHTQLTQTQKELGDTKATLAKTEDTLKQTQTDLASTKKERDTAVATAAQANKKADDAVAKLTSVTQERDTAQADLAAYKATGFSAQQVGSMSKTIAEQKGAIDAVNQENLVLLREKERLKNRLAMYEGTNYVITMRADLKGKVVATDPKWDFVVLNIGEAQGVKEFGQMLISRDGMLVAKVIVYSLDKNRCIANVMPGWKLGEVFEGDEVIPAYPATGT